MKLESAERALSVVRVGPFDVFVSGDEVVVEHELQQRFVEQPHYDHAHGQVLVTAVS
jgi:hypothetical protein